MQYKKEQYILGILRICMGFIFFWAFIDKLFGLGFSTSVAKSWISGGSPTLGFLSSSVGPFSNVYHMIAGNIVVDVLFMLGLFCVGLALLLGKYMKLAVWSGSLMFFLMWTAVFPPKTNPILDDHIIYILVLFLLLYTKSENYLGLGKTKK
jgi:thiosulfate dehydrogenase [quinone] large subunit